MVKTGPNIPGRFSFSRAIRLSVARMIMFSFMINAMLLGFLATSHAAAALSGTSLICGADGIISVVIDGQAPSDRDAAHHEDCISTCLAASSGLTGLSADIAPYPMPEQFQASLSAVYDQANVLTSRSITKARSPPSV